jgi:hypothetical protein
MSEIANLPEHALAVKLVYDVFGDTAKSFGKELGEMAGDNIKRVIQKAYHIVVAQGKSKGSVPPKVMKQVLEQAYLCNDEVQAAYLGGILASSKTEISRDDRAVSYLSLIQSLSTYQLRTHAIIYGAMLNGTDFNTNRDRLLVGEACSGVVESEYIAAMEYGEKEQSDIISRHAFIGLHERGLSWAGFELSYSTPPPPITPMAYRYFSPTPLGIELFVWGMGEGEKGNAAFEPELLKRCNWPFIITPSGFASYRVVLGNRL